MPLNSIRLDGYHLDEGIQSHVSDVIILVGKEFSKDIYTKHPQSRIRVDIKNAEHSLIEN